MSDDLKQAAKDLAVRATVFMSKSRVFGPEGAAAPNVAALPEEEYGNFIHAGALAPPYDPITLCHVYENSGSLQPNVMAYATNVESFGYRLEPTIDLAAADADQRIEDAILLEKLHEYPDIDAQVSPEEVAARREEIIRGARMERLHLELYFAHCVTDGSSFVELREKTRVDLEVTGNAYWEIIRNNRGQISQLGYVQTLTCRLMPADIEYSEVLTPQKVSTLSYRKVAVQRKYRRYVQIVNGQDVVVFKEFGDPRVVCAKTGRVYKDREEFLAADPNGVEASEILHFRIHSPRSSYGVPRWIGNLLAVLGSRASEEVNYLYFDNKGVPPLAITVAGGTLAKDAVGRIERYINEEIRGRENFHNLLLIEAEAQPGTMNGRIRIDFHPLMQAQQQDALFQKYKENNDEAIGQSFRVPKILRGSTGDINRATAIASLEFAEKLVFEPERARFDHIINTRLFAAMGIRYWTFKSNAPIVRDPNAIATMVAQLCPVGVLTPEEGREIAVDIFNRPFAPITADWVKQPVVLTSAGLKAEQSQIPGSPAPGEQLPAGGEVTPADVPPGGSAPEEPASPQGSIHDKLESLRTALAGGAANGPHGASIVEGLRALAESIRPGEQKADGEDAEPHVVHVPSAEFGSWFEKQEPPAAPPEASAAE